MKMTLDNKFNLITLKNSCGLEMKFREDGRFHSMRKGELIINQLETELYEKPLKNIWIRLYEEDKIVKIISALDFTKEISFTYDDHKIQYSIDNEFFVGTLTTGLSREGEIISDKLVLKNRSQEKLVFDIISGSDLALANYGAVKNNEAYTCQYIDHKTFNSEKYGYINCSRQNMGQGDKNPFVQIGASKKILGFSTDGFQFFGTDYRVSNEIKKLYSPSLENRNYQYEFAYITLQSEKFILDSGAAEEISFYTLFKENIPEGNVTEFFPVENILEKIENSSSTAENSGKYQPSLFGELDFFDSRDAENSDVLNFYPERKHSEYADGRLISFFTPEGFYVTMKDKERRVERNTGHIMMSGNFLTDRDNMISSTSFGMGIFNSQITVGNTSFNKLMGINRNPLNLQKFSGQRIFIKRENGYTQLGTPTFYEIGYNSCRWIYLSEDEKIVVRTFTSGDSPVLALEILSSNSHDFIITNHLVFGANEFDSVIEAKVSKRRIDIKGKNKLIESAYENLKFAYTFNQDFQILDTAGQNLIVKLTGNNLKINILGSVERNEIKSDKFINYSQEKEKFAEKLSAVIGGFKISSASHEMDKISDMGLWYAHNAMIHFASPHGLEQYSGAAWGTRDVSQGPFELFMSTQNYGEAGKILKEIYKHQYIETGVWPQWFMFDNYAKIQQEECHGDIVVWPIKITADYIKASGDYKILDTPVAFTSIEDGFNFTEKKESILNHLKKQIQYIKNNLIPGTYLLSYGDGDWDDTLQPKNSQLRKNMVSCWTVELLIQSLNALGGELKKHGIHDAFAEEVIELEELMREDFKKYAIQNDVVSGFLLHENGVFKPMLHPEDRITNIKYRLLPMTRGIISEIFDAEEAERHYSIIQKNLLFPDGVRLMAEPITYQGGKQSYFKRAEQASNVGREIGLQYCHAHIRYIESLCKLGRGSEAVENVLKLIPIRIDENVKNAELRQSNAFFSSSDAAFYDRYEFKEQFDKLKSGEVKVKGGWRVYSSGPGILLNQIISNLFGIRDVGENIVLDPVLSNKENSYKISFKLLEKDCDIEFILAEKEHTPESVTVNGEKITIAGYEKNMYRTGGAIISKNSIKPLLKEGKNSIKVYL